MLEFKKDVLFKAVLENGMTRKDNGACENLDNKKGTWVYGLPIRHSPNAIPTQMYVPKYDGVEIVTFKPNTLCQYVNIVVNGEKLFENDIVFDGVDTKYGVLWDNNKWQLVEIEGGLALAYDLNKLKYMPNPQIVGNVHKSSDDENTKEEPVKQRLLGKPEYFKEVCGFCSMLEFRVRSLVRRDRYGWQTFNIGDIKVGCELDSFDGFAKYYHLNEDGEDIEEMEFCPRCKKKISKHIPSEILREKLNEPLEELNDPLAFTRWNFHPWWVYPYSFSRDSLAYSTRELQNQEIKPKKAKGKKND